MVQHPMMRKVQHLHFLSREGHVLAQLHASIRQRFPELNLPAGSYFYTSRRVALCAAQAAAFSPREIVAGASFRGTLRDLLYHRLGLDLDGASDLAEGQLELPRDEEKLHSALAMLRPVIVDQAIGERERLIDYARQSGMLEAGLQGVVDIGYSATIQKALQVALAIPLTGFYLATFEAAKSVQDGGGQAFGCLAEGIPPRTSRAPVLVNPLLMESFLTAPHGQVTGFHEDEGRILPEFKATSYTAHELALMAEMQQGALDYCKDLLDIYGIDLLYAEIEEGTPQEFYRMALEGRLVVPIEVENMLRVDDDFCGNGQMGVGLGAL
jgi:hypothetical protein